MIPCKDCNDRQLGCHDHCERYKEFKSRLVKISENRHGSNRINTALYESTRRRMKSRKERSNGL